MTNKRIVNIRITFVAFVGLMLGILFGFNWYLNRIKTTLAIVMLVGVLMLCVAIIIYAIKTKSYNEKIEYRKNISKILLVSSIVFFVVFILNVIIYSHFLKSLFSSMLLLLFDVFLFYCYITFLSILIIGYNILIIIYTSFIGIYVLYLFLLLLFYYLL